LIKRRLTWSVGQISRASTAREIETRAAQGESSVWYAYRTRRADLITISWQRRGRLNKNITCFGGADPRLDASTSHVRLSVDARFRGSEVEWNGASSDSLPLGRRGEHARLIAHLRRAGRWAGLLPSPTGDWWSGCDRREAKGKQLSSLVSC